MKYFIPILVLIISSCQKPVSKKDDINHDMLEVASISEGRKQFVICLACHNINKGEPSRGTSKKQIFVGPNLHGVYNRKVASLSDFKFSEALKKHSSKSWTVENLDLYLKSPHRFAPNTSMKFPGIGDPQDRMDVIAYLMSLQ
ncbi:MAG: c-type cytochrome [Bacteriovoracaceae bacterium]